ncbi:hypothetical protein ACQEU5_21200 [Marinactinospora thermotolerans]|uniref:Uncharacterized protein n=1 Tax=Marinactinospora thermotolerans DSM 45154 TaxID=1122192 RepID=A0A1T4PHZ9_9ACTN|nr:hypothetical protein [Marinactinospora thermotolerans]SJZ90937.1 hypothetical protein SAMN02745673_01819 [Marinactinospora thermotolerans DSM 45154]
MREELLKHRREEFIEPPTPDRIARIAARLAPEVLAERLMPAVHAYGTNSGIRSTPVRR